MNKVDRVSKEARTMIKTARQFSKQIEKAGGGIDIGQILDMSMEEFLFICGQNNLKLRYGTPEQAMFNNTIVASHTTTEDKRLYDEGYTFLGVGQAVQYSEIHYFVKE